MVHAYRDSGRLIVVHKQGGKRRGAYGEAVTENLSSRLTAEYGRGFGMRNLRHIYPFYLAFPIHHALRDESASRPIRNALRSNSATPHAAGYESPALRPELSWTHCRMLLAVPLEERCARRDSSAQPQNPEALAVRRAVAPSLRLIAACRITSRDTLHREAAMAEAMAVRLDTHTRERLARAARRRRTTTSEVVRQAVEAWLERDGDRSRPASLMADLVGCVRGGDPGRSAGGGARVARDLRERRTR
jgi:predicted DNA-binding protein